MWNTADFRKGFIVCYLISAFFGGLAIKRDMPALNLLGVAYSGLLYLPSMILTATSSDFSIVPPPAIAMWMFDMNAFDEPANNEEVNPTVT